MKKLFSQFIPALVLMFLFFSCREDEALEQDITASETSSNHSADVLRTTFAKNLAAAVENEDLRVFLKGEALKRFDGDYDILFNAAKNSVVTKDGQTFAELLQANWQGEASLQEIQTALPTLNILIPDLLPAPTELWDAKKHTPLVAVMNSEQHQEGIDYLYAYDVSGQRQKLPAFEDPLETTIIIQSSERVAVVNGKKDGTNARKATEKEWVPLFQEGENQYYLINENFAPRALNLKNSQLNARKEIAGLPVQYLKYMSAANRFGDCPRETLYYGNTGELHYWIDERDNPLNVNIKERLQLFRFRSALAARTAADGWSEGSLELYCRVLLGGQNPEAFQSVLLTFSISRTEVQITTGASGYYRNLEKFLETKPSNVRNAYRYYIERGVSNGTIATIFDGVFDKASSQGVWINWGGQVVNWGIHKYGDRMKYVFYEYDAGETITAVKNYSVGFTATIGLNDKSNIGISTQKSGSVTYQYTNTSDQLGEHTVDYCGRYWTTQPPFIRGDIEFVVATY